MPVTQIARFHRPADLTEAWRLLTEEGAAGRLVGGGTDLTIHCPARIVALIDLAGLGLRFLHAEEDGSIRIGAMATLTDLLEDPAAAGYLGGVIPEMLVHVGSPLLRNAASLGGHLARGRISDVVPVLLAADAEVTIFDGATRRMPLEAYYADGRNREPHVLTDVFLPPTPRRGAAAFLRFSRSAFDQALVNTACRLDLDDGVVADARVVVGETPGLGRRLPAAEDALRHRPISEEAVAEAAGAGRGSVTTSGSWVVGAEYRSHLVEVAIARCLRAVAGKLGAGR